MVIWIILIALMIAVVILFYLLTQKTHTAVDLVKIETLEHKVDTLESNLQKTLEIMQELAKKMNVQQEVLDIHAQKLNQVENQNAELVLLLSKMINAKK